VFSIRWREDGNRKRYDDGGAEGSLEDHVGPRVSVLGALGFRFERG
jgi:hypothetical protein